MPITRETLLKISLAAGTFRNNKLLHLHISRRGTGSRRIDRLHARLDSPGSFDALHTRSIPGDTSR